MDYDYATSFYMMMGELQWSFVNARVFIFLFLYCDIIIIFFFAMVGHTPIMGERS